jgi:hypothetical protein
MKKTYDLFVCLIFCYTPLTEAKALPRVDRTLVMQENDESGHALSVDQTFNPHFTQIPI